MKKQTSTDISQYTFSLIPLQDRVKVYGIVDAAITRITKGAKDRQDILSILMAELADNDDAEYLLTTLCTSTSRNGVATYPDSFTTGEFGFLISLCTAAFKHNFGEILAIHTHKD